jgi:anti-sigma regulatory factor (Ser/Thr protein kinase)
MAASIQLTVPGTLRYRAIAVRVVAEAARMVSGSGRRAPNELLDLEVRDPFDTAVVSAFMEIFNNVAIHAYRRKGGGRVDIAITLSKAELVIEVTDHGEAFDLDEVPELPAELDEHSLPERGMGIHIAKAMLDEVTYEPGPPNLWRLCKRLPANPLASGAGRS